MHVACLCLNLSLRTKIIFFTDVSVADLYTDHPFFKEDLGLLPYCEATAQVPELVREVDSGQWFIVTCLNCKQYVYAVSYKQLFKKGDFILARKDLLLDSKKIESIHHNELYSPIFRMIIYQNDVSSDDEADDTDIPLYPKAAEEMDNQTKLMEKKIAAYRKREYAALDKLRKNTNKQQNVTKRCEEAYGHEILVQHSPNTQCSASSDAEGVFIQGPEASDSDESEDLATSQPERFGRFDMTNSLPPLIPSPMFVENPLLGSPAKQTDFAESFQGEC